MKGIHCWSSPSLDKQLTSYAQDGLCGLVSVKRLCWEERVNHHSPGDVFCPSQANDQGGIRWESHLIIHGHSASLISLEMSCACFDNASIRDSRQGFPQSLDRSCSSPPTGIWGKSREDLRSLGIYNQPQAPSVCVFPGGCVTLCFPRITQPMSNDAYGVWQLPFPGVPHSSHQLQTHLEGGHLFSWCYCKAFSKRHLLF